ncbi:MAG: hypothetical protein CL928_14025, partial [Deltaproteobacteria bacterium]|nr:hypothetical protein [Deltaproteobacteria bacterium]
MRLLQNILLAAFVTSTSILSAGCGDDCTVYCRNQANLIEQCLPQFEQGWSDVGEGDWDNRGQFVAGCVEQIDEYIDQDVEETCDADNDETYQDCQRTVREAAVRSCGDHLNDFRRSCSDYWRGVLDFTPAAYDPEPLPDGDDDDSAGDDDDSAGDDDDSAGDDDDSAG